MQANAPIRRFCNGESPLQSACCITVCVDRLWFAYGSYGFFAYEFHSLMAFSYGVLAYGSSAYAKFCRCLSETSLPVLLNGNSQWRLSKKVELFKRKSDSNGKTQMQNLNRSHWLPFVCVYVRLSVFAISAIALSSRRSPLLSMATAETLPASKRRIEKRVCVCAFDCMHSGACHFGAMAAARAAG